MANDNRGVTPAEQMREAAAQSLSLAAAYWDGEAEAASDARRLQLSFQYQAKAIVCREQAAAIRNLPLPPEPALADSDPPCTCCGGTGVTYQTERRCACQPALTLAAALEVPEIAAVVEAVDYILDGMGIDHPDYKVDPDDDFLDVATEDWVCDTLTRLARARAALTKETDQ